MKKMIVIFLGLLSFNAYSYDATKGALQNDPSLCQYGYNPNCGSKNRSAPTTEIIYYNVDVKVPPLFAALAFSRQTAYLAGAANQDSLDIAKKKAIKSVKKVVAILLVKLLYGSRMVVLLLLKEKQMTHMFYLLVQVTQERQRELLCKIV